MGFEGYSGMKKVTKEIRPGQVLLMILGWAVWVIGFLMWLWAASLQAFANHDSRLVFIVIALVLWAGGGLLGPLFLRRVLKPTGKGWIGTVLLALHIPLYVLATLEMVKMIAAFGGAWGPPVSW